MNNSLILVSLERNKHLAHFKDSLGSERVVRIVSGSIPDVILKSDLDNARKMFLNKRLWMNVTEIYEGKNINDGTGKKITGMRFEPVTVSDIGIGNLNDDPQAFTVKTSKGEFGYLHLNISGTNSDLDPKHSFNHFFLTEDPHLKYHFTPAVWKMVQAGYTEIGMPMEAFQLVMGPADKINTSQTAKGITQQWVYGNSYYYFAGGKLTAKQN